MGEAQQVIEMSEPRRPRKVKHYASIGADTNLKTEGGMGEAAVRIRAAAAGNIVVVHDLDSAQETIPVQLGETIEGEFREIKQTGTTATGLTVTW